MEELTDSYDGSSGTLIYFVLFSKLHKSEKKIGMTILFYAESVAVQFKLLFLATLYPIRCSYRKITICWKL